MRGHDAAALLKRIHYNAYHCSVWPATTPVDTLPPPRCHSGMADSRRAPPPPPVHPFKTNFRQRAGLPAAVSVKISVFVALSNLNWENQMDKFSLRNPITGMAPVPFRFSVAFGPSNVLKKQRTQQADELFARSDAVCGRQALRYIQDISADRQAGRQASEQAGSHRSDRLQDMLATSRHADSTR